MCRVKMNRRVFLLSSAGALLLANTAFAAASHEEGVARALIGQGYRITSRRRTWLGRVRFTAEKGRIEREVVLDPSSGEILRDYSSADGGADRPVRPGGGDGGHGDAASGGGDSAGGGGASGDGGSAAGGEPSGGDGESPGGDGEPSGGGETAGGGEKEATGEKESTGGVKEAGRGETTGGRKEKSDARR